MIDHGSFVGKSIGNYRIVALIGSGGFGSVYRGEHTILKERMVAIKILHNYLSSPQERGHFLQEAQLLEHNQHPHILQIMDAGIDNGLPYLVTEYATHGSLRDLLKRYAHAPLPTEMALTILTQVGEALDYAHHQQIVHRDLKPENILFNAHDAALLADFGIASTLTTSSVKYSSVIGTPSYMAPEQFQGTVSKEGDQYALGCIAYELFTGSAPFSAPDFFAMGFKHLTDQPIALTQLNPSIPEQIEQAILKAMAKQRGDRHADVHAFLVALLGSEYLESSSLSNRLPTYSNAHPSVLVGNIAFASAADISEAPTFIRAHESDLAQHIEQPTFLPTLLASQSGELRYTMPPNENLWNRQSPDRGHTHGGRRKGLILALACAVVVATLLTSLLFVFLPKIASSQTVMTTHNGSPIATTTPQSPKTVKPTTHAGQPTGATSTASTPITSFAPTSTATTPATSTATPPRKPRPTPTSPNRRCRASIRG